MPRRRTGLRRVEPRRLTPTDDFRLTTCRFAGVQHAMDMLQLFVELPTVVSRRLVYNANRNVKADIAIFVAILAETRMGAVPGGRLLRLGAEYLSTTGTAERLLLTRRQCGHILAAFFAPHRIVRIGRPADELYRFCRAYGAQNGHNNKLGNKG